MEEEKKEDLFDKLISSAWGKLLFAAGMAGAGVYLYIQLNLIASGERESMAVWAPVAFLYDFGGVWGGVSIFALFSFGFAFWGVKQLISGKE